MEEDLRKISSLTFIDFIDIFSISEEHRIKYVIPYFSLITSFNPTIHRVTFFNMHNMIVLERRNSMKKFLLKYYAVIIMILFIIYNLVLTNLKIGGLLYQIYMVLFISINIFIHIIFKKDIKCKSLVILAYFFIWLFSKNTLQCIFGISSMIVLLITGFMEKNIIKIIAIGITIFFVIFAAPLFFVYLLNFGTGLSEDKERNDIYEDTHYYCDHNYEIYSYSAGAMDRYHYSIGKYYEILDINDIVYIHYIERNEVSHEEYENYLKKHKCILAGDKNGFK